MRWPGLPDQMPRAHDGANTYGCVGTGRAERGVGVGATLGLLNTSTAVQTEPFGPSPRPHQWRTGRASQKGPGCPQRGYAQSMAGCLLPTSSQHWSKKYQVLRRMAPREALEYLYLDVWGSTLLSPHNGKQAQRDNANMAESKPCVEEVRCSHRLVYVVNRRTTPSATGARHGIPG